MPHAIAQNEPHANARRTYVDGRYGQVHVRFRSDGRRQGRPLVCFHATPLSSRMFEPFIAALDDRPVYALDTPGYGESDRPPAPLSVVDYSAALWEAVEGLKLGGSVDLLGVHTGTRLAVEMALTHPERVRRVIFVGCAVYTPEEREEQKRWSYENEIPVATESSAVQIARIWASFQKWRRVGVDDALLERRMSEILRDRQYSSWAHVGVFAHDLRTRLPLLEQPVLIINADDDLHTPTQRAPELVRDCRFFDLSPAGFGVLETHTAQCVKLIRDFLG